MNDTTASTHHFSPPAVSRPAELGVPPEPQESGWEFVGFVWRRLWLILLAVVVAVGLGYLHFLRQPNVFRSSGRMLIVRQRARMPIAGIEAESRFDSTHETLLRSPVIINQAIEKHDLVSLPSFRDTGDPASRIIANLSVSASANASGDLVRFTYSSGDPDECRKVLEAVIDAYRDFLDDTYHDVNQETVHLITQAKDVLDRQITETQRGYQEFRETAPLLYLGGEGRNVHEGRLQQIENMRSSLQFENWQTQAQIDAIEAAMKRGADREVLNLILGQIRESGRETGRESIEERLFPMILEEQMLLDRFGPDHPQVVTIRRRIALHREHLLGTTPSGETSSPMEFCNVYLESLREQMRMNDEQAASISRLFEQESDEARSIDKYQVRDANFRGEIARKERMFDAVVARLEEINISMELSGIKTQVVHPPGRGSQVAPDRNQILTTAGILGLLAGLGLAFVVDSLDRRFRSPHDIRNEFGLPIVGHIPVIPADQPVERDSPFDASLQVIHHPRGRIAEAFRAVRTAVYFNSRGGTHKVLQVTSPTLGDGKTTLAANLAVSIALSGKRTLLIDADFRRPRLHRVFGISDTPGFCDVLAGNVELIDAIQEPEIENLSVLATGKRPSNPAELLTGSGFQQLIEMLREKYEFVILDTPPILVVTDPLVVAPRVDATLLVVRLVKSARSDVHEVIEALDSVGASLLGLVVNRVGDRRRYSYGGYKYGYGGYRYGYRYGYGPSGDEKDRLGEKSSVPADDGS